MSFEKNGAGQAVRRDAVEWSWNTSMRADLLEGILLVSNAIRFNDSDDDEELHEMFLPHLDELNGEIYESIGQPVRCAGMTWWRDAEGWHNEAIMFDSPEFEGLSIVDETTHGKDLPNELRLHPICFSFTPPEGAEGDLYFIVPNAEDQFLIWELDVQQSIESDDILWALVEVASMYQKVLLRGENEYAAKILKQIQVKVDEVQSYWQKTELDVDAYYDLMMIEGDTDQWHYDIIHRESGRLEGRNLRVVVPEFEMFNLAESDDESVAKSFPFSDGMPHIELEDEASGTFRWIPIDKITAINSADTD